MLRANVKRGGNDQASKAITHTNSKILDLDLISSDQICKYLSKINLVGKRTLHFTANHLYNLRPHSINNNLNSNFENKTFVCNEWNANRLEIIFLRNVYKHRFVKCRRQMTEKNGIVKLFDYFLKF